MILGQAYFTLHVNTSLDGGAKPRLSLHILPAGEGEEPCDGVCVPLGHGEHVAVHVSEPVMAPGHFSETKLIAHIHVNSCQSGLHKAQ